MSSIHVIFYQEKEGRAPAVEWLRELHETNVKAFLKCRAAIARLADINRAITRKATFTMNPTAHTFRGEIEDA